MEQIVALSPEERLAFEVDFVRIWHSANPPPSLVLINWKRAFRDSARLRCTAAEAACIQLWDLNRDAAYAMSGRLPRQRPDVR